MQRVRLCLLLQNERRLRRQQPVGALRRHDVESNPFKAVTFVANHDTDETEQDAGIRLHPYHEGYPTIFYRDYEEWLDKEKAEQPDLIHNNKATGTTSILYADNDEYVARLANSSTLIGST